MPDVTKPSWFGRQVTVLMSNGKSLTGELAEVSDRFIVLQPKSGVETQIMVHAIIAIRPAKGEGEEG